MKAGNASTMSTIRWMRMSGHPPKYPEVAPSGMPIASPSATAASAMNSVNRAP
jgi:hypothetical protein